MRKLNRVIVIIVIILYSGIISAAEFETEGICYSISGNSNTASVIGKNKSYTGNIVIPESVSFQGQVYEVVLIDDDAFYGCTDITSITLPPTIRCINESAFSGCINIESVYISDIRDWFSISFEEDGPVTTNPLAYAKHLFVNGEEVNDIVVPEGVEWIEEDFPDFVGLNSVVLPSSLRILDRAFIGCSNLHRVISTTTTLPYVEEVNWRPFRGIANDAKLIVPIGCKDLYLSSLAWNDSFQEIVEAENYNLEIKDTQNGIIMYGGNCIPIEGGFFSILEGSIASFIFKPNPGFKLKNVRLNNTNITSDIINNRYKINNINGNISLKVEFEAQSPIISFADANVKAICVSNWDTNGDGELSEDEAAAVTDLGEVFKQNTSITSFDELRYFTGLTSINDNAFRECGNLSSTIIPNGVKTIGACSFYGCNKLTSIVIPDGVKTIDGYAFMGCSSMASVDIPSSVTTIAYDVFNGCSSLTSIQIPNNVTRIDNGTFSGCSNLSSIYIHDGVESIGASAFMNCSSLRSVNIPKGVKIIGSGTFYGCSSLTSISIPNEVRIIGPRAFEGCTGLTSINIPSQVNTIGERSFYGCGALTSVTIDVKMPIAITEDVFSNRANANLTVPAGCKSSYKAADYWKEFKVIIEISAPSPVIFFADAKVKALCVANWDTNGDGELSEAEAAAVTTLRNVFKENRVITSFNELQYFTGLTSINSEAFYYCTKLSSFIIPANVKSIGNNAFFDCESLTSLIIPRSVTSIGTGAFLDCGYGLSSIVVESGNTKFDSRENCNAIIETATNTLLWGCNNTTIPNSVTAIGNSAFSHCLNMNSIVIPDGVTSIGNWAFYNCRKLTTVVIPENVKSIGEEAFWHCDALNSITIGKNVSSIGNCAFQQCANLKSVISEITNPFAISEDVFSYISSEAVLQVPKGTKSLYQAYTGWTSNFKSIEEYGLSNYDLNISVIGNGYATYNGTIVRGGSQSFSVTEGSSATISFTPDMGYRLKSVKLNNTDNTSSVTNNQYTISNISTNTTLEVEFEAVGDRPYAVLSNNNTVLTFYYDDQIYSREGMSVQDLGWLQMSSSITTVQFDRSFASYSPTCTAYWFNGMQQLHTLDLSNLTMTSVTNTEGMFQSCTMLTTIYVNDTWPAAESTMTSDGSSSVSGFDMFNGCRSLVGGAGTCYDAQHKDYSYAHIDGGWNNPGYFTSNTMYSLSIKATGNGYATYNGTTIRGGSQIFSLIESSLATISFTPDAGYRLKSVKLNNVDVTTNVTNGQYTIYNINDNTTLEVEFEAIPVTTYSLSITATGNGYATYGSTTIRSKTSSFTVNEGTSAQITFVPDNGYRIAKVLQDDVDVTASVVNNKYTINSISANITLKVTFEEIPPTTYTLTVTASGNGSVTYENITLQNQTKDFTVTEGTYATLVFTPESGYRVASVKVNWATISPIEANQYTINNITSNTTVVVTFEPIPVTAYSLSITASGNGSATFNNTTIRNKTQQFSVVEGTNVLVTFSPDNGHSVGSVKVNGADVTNEVAGNSYEIKNFSASTVLEVVFIENVNALTVDGVNYSVTSQTNKTVIVVGGNYGQLLTVPATFTQYGTTWTVTGIDADALKSNSELAAVMWDAEAPFTATVSNPNLLLYVKATEYANNTIKNVIVNGVASSITLYDASNGNNFYCPKAFLAHHISYTHHYGMITGINEAKGWETIALPFDVQTITHASKGKIVPFATWQETNSEKPFWLYEMTGTGFVKANSIKAQIPYIISMPNNSEYYSEWLLNGNVTFAASEVYVYVTDELQSITSNGKSFYPCFTNKSSTEGLYALNVNNDYAQNNSGTAEGSRFVLNMRQIHPFEAYMTTEYASRTFIPIFEESTPTDIPGIMLKGDTGSEKWHTLDGLLLQSKPTTKGVYILNGKKVVVK